MKKCIIGIIIILQTVSAFASSSPSLKVGMDLSSPPFEMICTNGSPCGISVDIARALGHFLNRDVDIQNISFIGLIPALKNEKIDAVISSLTVTEQRKKSIDFSIPYAVTGLCLLINHQTSLDGIGNANRPDCSIVVKSGTTGEVYAAQHLTKANVRVLEKESYCVMEVIQGKADGFIYDQLSVYKIWQKNLSTTRALLNPFQKEYWAIGIRKGNDELLKQVDHFIRSFREEGGFEKLSDTYLPMEKAAFKKLGIPFIFS
jgi:polar amino acid transport system substrate-binding protein